jgi:phospholipid transport system substrate-binding protein
MKRLRLWVFSVIAAMTVAAFSLTAWGADAPSDVVQRTIEKTLAVLQDPSLQGQARRQERLAKAEELILPHCDTEAFGRAALGTYWAQRSPAEQREFVSVLTALVARTYVDNIDRNARDVKVVYDKQTVDGSNAEVDTRVFSPSAEQPISINYMMDQINGQWLVYDIQVDNISIVLNYRSQVSHFLNKSSYADLIKTMKARLRKITSSA